MTKGKFPTVKKVILAFRGKNARNGSPHIILIYSYEIVQVYSYMLCSDTNFLLLLLLYMCVE